MRRVAGLLILGSLFMTGCATTYKAGAPRGAIDVIAHRGASAYAPENTLAAFELAVEQGADWFELDCTLSKDGAVIVIHDDDVERTTGTPGKVRDLTLSEVKALDAGLWFDAAFAGEKMPTLEESLDLAKDRIGVYIEIKNSDNDDDLMRRILRVADRSQRRFSRKQRKEMMALIEESGTRNLELTRKCIAAVRERDMAKQVVIQSFSPVVCAVAVEEAPDIRVELLGAKSEDNPGRWPTYMRWCYLIDVDGFNASFDSLSREQIAEFHGGHRSSAVWTVDEPAKMRRCVDWDADGIITNKPDVCLALLRELGKR